MKTHKNLYSKLCSNENLYLAYKGARKGKTQKDSVIEFESNLIENLNSLQMELSNLTYHPRPLKRFIIRDPKIRTIHASAFRDRIVHHAIINIIEPIFEKMFIYDSYASRKNKGTHLAVKRFVYFMRKVTQNGCVFPKGAKDKNKVQGYCLKADIRHYFETVNHQILLGIITKKVNDAKIIWLIKKVLDNFDSQNEHTGMPLGNFTSQFFANVYLNELDYFVKHGLKAKYYIRYVDDFIILHRSKRRLEYFMCEITTFLINLQLELHPDKTQIVPLQKGAKFLGYRVFYYYKLLCKRNMSRFYKRFEKQLDKCKRGEMTPEDLIEKLQGWFGYAKWANTFKVRENIIKQIEQLK
jgi:RNA-directed DNA polymerase